MSRRTQDPARLRSDFAYGACTLFGTASNRFLLSSLLPSRSPSTPILRSVWAPPVSLAATPGIILIFFSYGYLDVSVPRVPLIKLCIYFMMTGLLPAGFPHSDIDASSLPNSFTSLFAVWHVLLQFRVARHSPYALPYLIMVLFVCFRDVFQNCSINYFRKIFTKRF